MNLKIFILFLAFSKFSFGAPENIKQHVQQSKINKIPQVRHPGYILDETTGAKWFCGCVAPGILVMLWLLMNYTHECCKYYKYCK